MHEFEPFDIEDFDGSGADSPDEAQAFQFGEGARRGLAGRRQIIGDIETADGQIQERLLAVEEFRHPRKIEQDAGQPLIGVLLPESHQPRLCLTEIVQDLGQQIRQKLRLLPHELLHSLPRQAVDSRLRSRLGGIQVKARFRHTEQIAGHSECENLAMTVFGASADSDDAAFHKEDELAGIALSENKFAAPMGVDRGNSANVILLSSGKRAGVRLPEADRPL